MVKKIKQYSKEELTIMKRIETIQSEKRKILRQIDDMDTEIIGLKEELLSIRNKKR